MPDITIPDAAVEAAAHIIARWNGDVPWSNLEQWRSGARTILADAAPFIAAQERQRVADEIDLPAVMAHLLRGSRDDLILADRINVAIGASRVRRIEAEHG